MDYFQPANSSFGQPICYILAEDDYDHQTLLTSYGKRYPVVSAHDSRSTRTCDAVEGSLESGSSTAHSPPYNCGTRSPMGRLVCEQKLSRTIPVGQLTYDIQFTTAWRSPADSAYLLTYSRQTLRNGVYRMGRMSQVYGSARHLQKHWGAGESGILRLRHG